MVKVISEVSPNIETGEIQNSLGNIGRYQLNKTKE